MSHVAMRTLNVTSNTSLRDLHDFAAKAGENSRIRGKMVDGQLQLYAKPDSNKFGLLSKLSPSAIYHRHVGQKALAKIFDNHQKQTGAPVGAALSGSVKTPVGGDIKAGLLNVNAAIAAFRPVKKDEDTVAAGDTVGPSAQTLGLDKAEVKAALAEAALAVKNGDDPAAATAKLAKLLSDNFEASGPSDEDRRNFSTSLGDSERHAMMLDMIPQVYPGKTKDTQLFRPQLEPLKNIINAAYDQAAAKATPDQFKNEFEFTLGGVTYKADPNVPPLGQGGFGIVREFVPSDGSPSVAVKIGHPSSDPDKRMQNSIEALKEIALHKKVEGEGHENVTQMKGALRLPGGGFAIVLEMAKFGDLKGFSNKIGDAVAAGVITKQEALLAQRGATRDMLQGIAHSHANGMMNQDVKDENFLVTDDGTVKLADNGGARERDGYDYTSQGTSTPTYLSPEAANFNAVRDDVGEVMGEIGLRPITGQTTPKPGETVPTFTATPQRTGNATDAAVDDLIARQFPKASPEQRQTIAADYKEALNQQILDGQLSPEKRDGYAVGLAAQKLVYAKGTHGTPVVLPGDTSGYGVELTALRDLVARLSDADVGKRLSPRDALDDPAVSMTDDQIAAGRDIMKRVGNWARAEASKVQVPPLFQTSVRATPSDDDSQASAVSGRDADLHGQLQQELQRSSSMSFA